MRPSTAKSPPTRRVVEVLDALADSNAALTSAEIARRCGISTSTCALVLAELEDADWVCRHDGRRYRLSSGLFGIVHGLRAQFPLLDSGREVLTDLHRTLDAACSMSRIGERQLTIVDSVGHSADSEYAVGQGFPIDPPFGLVAMAWRDDDDVDAWLRRVTPRLTEADVNDHRRVLADIRARGYGAWRFDDAHASLHDRLTGVLASLGPAAAVARQLTTLMTMVTLTSVTKTLEKDVKTTEFLVLPIFGPTGQPEYQIQIRLNRPGALTFAEVDDALTNAQRRVTSTSPSNQPYKQLRG
ncbi:MarR family transcriptional regulator [Mycobacterium sp.]|uniref:MarR family transcriptional regulator n=1 Tax=Mycobacterium sp. TaxID=1785 RepID=UPI002D224674|nr:MarR family transcriptional regulator [Mycobacterium sp.]HZA11309.1 MarR family transcriptional regulator [Mycobacterium sp.]